jgi:hypothetical protein
VTKLKTLEDYFKENFEEGRVEFSVMANINNDNKVEFYIRPTDKDGETIDFVVEGNSLRRV